jgi:hypothetical protein
VPHAGSVADNLAETHLNFGKNAWRGASIRLEGFIAGHLRDSFFSPLTAFTASGLLFRILGSRGRAYTWDDRGGNRIRRLGGPQMSDCSISGFNGCSSL